jgi:hypothetical protein
MLVTCAYSPFPMLVSFDAREYRGTLPTSYRSAQVRFRADEVLTRHQRSDAVPLTADKTPRTFSMGIVALRDPIEWKGVDNVG